MSQFNKLQKIIIKIIIWSPYVVFIWLLVFKRTYERELFIHPVGKICLGLVVLLSFINYIVLSGAYKLVNQHETNNISKGINYHTVNFVIGFISFVLLTSPSLIIFYRAPFYFILDTFN